MIGDPSGPGAALGGRPLSGGERRRLLIARALLTGADILMVDEPAEHLDPQTADALLEGLFATGRTVVVVTHRVSGLEAADEVLVVGDGRITARGPARGSPDHPSAVPGHLARRTRRPGSRRCRVALDCDVTSHLHTGQIRAKTLADLTVATELRDVVLS